MIRLRITRQRIDVLIVAALAAVAERRTAGPGERCAMLLAHLQTLTGDELHEIASLVELGAGKAPTLLDARYRTVRDVARRRACVEQRLTNRQRLAELLVGGLLSVGRLRPSVDITAKVQVTHARNDR